LAKDNTIVGLDIGTSKIRTVIATVDAREMLPNVVGAGVSPSSGLRKGAIVDVNETIAAITASLEDAERMSGQPIHHAVIAVGGSHLASQNSRGVIAVPHGGEITVSDVERVLEAAQAVNIQANRQILHVIPKSYTVDDQQDIRNPLGMRGVRLEVEAHIITGLTPALKNLENAVHQSGVDVDDFVPASLAAAEAVLSKRQKELGVVSIDIGASSTSIAVFEEGAILGTFVLPIGGDAVSNDIAIGLKTSIDTAEKLKIEYGSCNPVEISERETVDLAAISKTDSQVIERRTLAEIIQASCLLAQCLPVAAPRSQK
jgi:cell division protein FtsA